MYGYGVYFASDSSKSAQNMYTKGSDKLLLCEVLLGKSLTVDKPCNDMTLAKFKRKQHDSLFAKRDTRQSGGVLFDEFVIYNPDQAFPKYIIHYQKSGLPLESPNMMLTFQGGFQTARQEVLPSRTLKPGDPLDTHYRIAESQFLRLLKKLGNNQNIDVKKVEIFMHPVLQQKFNRKMAEFTNKYGASDTKSQFLYLFHGTKSAGIVSNIMDNNFIPSTGGKFGAGVYFSEFPSYTFGYGGSNHLILSKVLPGEIKDCSSHHASQSGFDSLGGIPRGERFSEIVIQNVDQILPCYVLHIS